MLLFTKTSKYRYALKVYTAGTSKYRYALKVYIAGTTCSL